MSLPIIERIFLDLDDVLNVFTPHTISRFTGEPPDYSYKSYPAELGYDIKAAINKDLARLGKSSLDCNYREFWEMLPRDFWATVPKSPHCDWILRLAASAVGKHNVFICSRPMPTGDCYSGKLDWTKSQLGDFLVDSLVLTSHKWIAANNSLLVDDNVENCESFGEHGGHAILMPRPWSEKLAWVKEPEKYVLDSMAKFFPVTKSGAELSRFGGGRVTLKVPSMIGVPLDSNGAPAR